MNYYRVWVLQLTSQIFKRLDIFFTSQRSRKTINFYWKLYIYLVFAYFDWNVHDFYLTSIWLIYYKLRPEDWHCWHSLTWETFFASVLLTWSLDSRFCLSFSSSSLLISLFAFSSSSVFSFSSISFSSEFSLKR